MARFVGSPAMNLLPADGPVQPVGEPGFTGLTAGHQIGFRPEAVRLGQTTASTTAMTPGVVERVDVVGEDAYVYCQTTGPLVVARVPAARASPARRRRHRLRPLA